MGKDQPILSEKELWEKFLAGDNESIAIVYKRYANDLFTYGLKVVNDEALVKDCIQEIFFNLIDNRRTLIIGSHIHIYLFKSLRNKLLDEMRYVSRKYEILESKEINSYDTCFESKEREIVHEEERTHIQKVISEALCSLSNKQKEIIYLKYTQGLSYDEIALLLGINKASARTLLYRTLKTVREELTEKVIFLVSIFLRKERKLPLM